MSAGEARLSGAPLATIDLTAAVIPTNRILRALSEIEVHARKTAEATESSFEEAFKDTASAATSAFGAVGSIFDSLEGKASGAADAVAGFANILPHISSKTGAAGALIGGLTGAVWKLTEAFRKLNFETVSGISDVFDVEAAGQVGAFEKNSRQSDLA